MQVAVALGVGLVVGVLEQVELDLAGHHRQEAERRGGLLLAPQHRARRDLDQLAGVDVEQVAHDHRRLVDPRNPAHRVPVGAGQHVAVALLVAGEPVAGHRVVVHVAGDQVVAVLRAGVGDRLEEEPSRRALAREPALQIGEDHQHRVDLTAADVALQLLTAHFGSSGHGDAL